MPGFGTTDLTKTNSWKLMEQLGITIRMINITDACLQHFEDIGHNAIATMSHMRTRRQESVPRF